MEIGKIRHIGIETDIHERRHVESSVTRFGNFWNFLATNFIIKVAQIVWCFWAVVKLFKSNWLGYFLGNFWKTCATFISTSGHTGATRE